MTTISHLKRSGNKWFISWRLFMKTVDDQNHLISAQLWHHFIRKNYLARWAARGVLVPQPEIKPNPCLLQWKLRVWTTGPAGSPSVTSNCRDKACEGFGLQDLLSGTCPYDFTGVQSCKGIKDNPGWPPHFTDGEELASGLRSGYIKARLSTLASNSHL